MNLSRNDYINFVLKTLGIDERSCGVTKTPRSTFWGSIYEISKRDAERIIEVLEKHPEYKLNAVWDDQHCYLSSQPAYVRIFGIDKEVVPLAIKYLG